MPQELPQLLIAQLPERGFPALGSQRGVADDALLPLGANPAGEDQPEFILDVLGSPPADLHFPLLAVDLDDPARHVRSRFPGGSAGRL